ncbi:glycosyltransferase family 2 protein [Aquipuribacter nitratireducens]|uniref:Glycosyltransferase family 2 protein n=1 Tax=Aquipuribacter nitratireducens TaxID=650104 RepID=A0ABW0GKI7_9MICO
MTHRSYGPATATRSSGDGPPPWTVVVMTRDRLPGLEGSLPHHEGPVVVVDNGSRDGTVEALAGREGVRVLALGENRGATARTVGARAAGTELVAFADDDSWWAPGALARAAEHFAAHPRLGLLAARVLVGPEERPDPVNAVMAASPLGRTRAGDVLPGPAVLGFLACGAVVRREAFLSVGGFDPVVFFRGEEERVALDLAAAGWACAYVDDVVAHHHPSSSRAPRPAALAEEARNDVLTAVMRRPWRVVVRRAVRAWRAGGPRRRGVAATLPRLPAALRARRRLPADVERQAALLDP